MKIDELRSKLAETSAQLEKLNEELSSSKNQSNDEDSEKLQERLTKKILENNKIIEENANLRSYVNKQKSIIYSNIYCY